MTNIFSNLGWTNFKGAIRPVIHLKISMERYAQLFQWEFGSKYSKSFLQHHSKKLLKYYSKMKSLLEVKGFSWDEMQQKIAAEDYVWDNYSSLLYPFGFWNSFLLYFTTTIVDIGTPRCLFV